MAVKMPSKSSRWNSLSAASASAALVPCGGARGRRGGTSGQQREAGRLGGACMRAGGGSAMQRQRQRSHGPPTNRRRQRRQPGAPRFTGSSAAEARTRGSTGTSTRRNIGRAAHLALHELLGRNHAAHRGDALRGGEEHVLWRGGGGGVRGRVRGGRPSAGGRGRRGAAVRAPGEAREVRGRRHTTPAAARRRAPRFPLAPHPSQRPASGGRRPASRRALLTGADQADALRAVLARDGGVGGGVGVGEHADLAVLVHPLHEHRQRACDTGRAGGGGERRARARWPCGEAGGGRRAARRLRAAPAPGPTGQASPPSRPGGRSPLISGALTGCLPSSTSPLEPLSDSQSPSRSVLPASVAVLPA